MTQRAPVDDQRRSGDEGRGVAGEEDDGALDVILFAESLKALRLTLMFVTAFKMLSAIERGEHRLRR